MKTDSPHDPLDELIASALHGELTPAERAQFESRLQTDPAAQAAYHEAQAMHDLLEKTHQRVQPDSNFEQRMVSGVRRKLQTEKHRETAWESLVILWKGMRSTFGRRSLWTYGGVCSVVLLLALAFVIKAGSQTKSVFTTITSELAVAGGGGGPVDRNGFDIARQKDLGDVIGKQGIKYVETAQKGITLSGYVDNGYTQQFAGKLTNLPQITNGSTSSTIMAGAGKLNLIGGSKNPDAVIINGGKLQMTSKAVAQSLTLSGGNTYTGGTTVSGGTLTEPTETTTPQGGTIRGRGFAVIDEAATAPKSGFERLNKGARVTDSSGKPAGPPPPTVVTDTKVAADSPAKPSVPTVTVRSGEQASQEAVRVFPYPQALAANDKEHYKKEQDRTASVHLTWNESITPDAIATPNNKPQTNVTEPAQVDDRKLIRNAQLDLEVKSFQTAMDQITALTRSAGGYVDTSNSEKGGNGKLQGTVVVKVLPQNLDAFLLKLRDLGQVQNQSVSTDDVTKDYFDTQARLENSRRMEAQLQELLKHENSKVSDLLQVERELGRVRGDIEQMQGQLKLYDFQVQYATVTMQMHEKDLNQAAAYLLKEQDEFSLFATDVEGTFQKARATADQFKTQVLIANLVHNSGSDVAAELTVMVAPDQVESFLAEVRGLGRVANFTRETQRVAKDGGDSDQPADQTLTEKDKVQVHLSIRSDDETRKQVALTVVAKAVDEALDHAKATALANAGVEILSSSLNKTPQGQSTAQLSLRVPGKDYASLMESFRSLGRTDSLSIQRNDNSGPGANGDDAPVIVSLSLTDEDAPLQETDMSVLTSDVDGQSQEIKKDAAAAGVEVKASSFQRQPDGTELAQMVFRLPMAKYPAFVESVKKLGKVEALTVRRDDRPDQTRTDDTAPAEISLQLHNQADVVTDDHGLWATLRQTFGQGAGALFTSVRVIGVLLAFTLPWFVAIVLIAWIGRRIYIWRKK